MRVLRNDRPRLRIESMKTISWKTTKAEFALIVQIADRSIELGVHSDRQSAIMDVTATHANGCPLRLAELLDAPKFDFAHDLAGIRRHLNRETGELMDCFVPRTARREVVS